MTETCELTVSGMHCQNCGLLIDDVLEDLTGVTRASTDVRRASTRVEYDPSQVDIDAMAEALAAVGYTATPAT